MTISARTGIFHSFGSINTTSRLDCGRKHLVSLCSHLLTADWIGLIERLGCVPITRIIVVVPKTSKMSPPINPPRQRKGFLRDLKSTDVQNFQIVQVDEDKQDEMYCSELVRRLIMLQPVTAAAAVFTGYRYWKLQFAQLLMLQSLGLNMNTRLLFAVIDFIVNSKRFFN